MKSKYKMKNILWTLLVFMMHLSISSFPVYAQQNSLVNTTGSAHAKLLPVDITSVSWTEGFWAERYAVCRDVMVPFMMGNYMDDELSHGFANFEIAAGLKEGRHAGPPFHDGDFFKILEALIVINAMENNPELDRQIDSIIHIIGMTQRADGYIHTPVVIEQNQHPENKQEFEERLDFETYNMGHLMTTASIHYRTTGKKNFLDIAVKAADFLYEFYKRKPEELARNAICPSHYMGVTELYRTTGDQRYLELAKGLIDIRSMVVDGTDHNQDRIPFRDQRKAVGHAVRANYLYAGAADVFTETGDISLYTALDSIWHDLTERKLYITGACGALYDGVSPNGTTYDQSSIQQVHQAYGQDYELPNLDAHNESCANIGNILWNWRMLQATGEARYTDIIEQVIYNSLPAGVSLDGKGYFYTNPLAVSGDLTYQLRWSKQREGYISYCNCCPPNTIRTIAEIHNYVYNISEEGVWINLYGANRLATSLKNGEKLVLTQETDYPWDGNIRIRIGSRSKEEYSVFLRIPGWSEDAVIRVNGKKIEEGLSPGSYSELKRKWKKGDVIELDIPMQVSLLQSNPLVEGNRNQVAIRRGPVVYCLESADIPDNSMISDIAIPIGTEFTPVKEVIGGSSITSLSAEVALTGQPGWGRELYREVIPGQLKTARIKFIPYFAWGNRGEGDMLVWIPVKW